MTPSRALLVSLAFATCASPALATGEIESLITQADRDRLAAFDATRAEALAEARAEGAPKDVETLNTIVDATPVSMRDFSLAGEWKCRTVKAGGSAGLVVYGWFACRVTDDGSGWRLEKLTGSQRTTGRFFTVSDERLTYLGSFYVAGDPVPDYGLGPESDQVGVVTRTSKARWRIEFPAPRFESKLDVLELAR